MVYGDLTEGDVWSSWCISEENRLRPHVFVVLRVGMHRNPAELRSNVVMHAFCA